jgi:folate-binding protein YgfZ
MTVSPLVLHSFHAGAGASFGGVNQQELVLDYGHPEAEFAALRETAGILDLGFRGRLCLTGADREKFLHGQVTNDINGLRIGSGCYAALVTAKGKMVSDLNIYRLENELLLDFEAGLTDRVRERLEHFVISEDVQVIDAAPHYGLISIQGPRAADTLAQLAGISEWPEKPMTILCQQHAAFGEIYLVNLPRFGSAGFDLFWPATSAAALAERLQTLLNFGAGRLAGWRASEIARVEAGIPRFGADMDESTLPPEAGLEARAVSYTKGCYIGQEVINRIRTYGQVAKALRRLQLDDQLAALPNRGDKLWHDGREVGLITSAATLPTGKKLALGYVRREVNSVGTRLQLRTGAGESDALIVG